MRYKQALYQDWKDGNIAHNDYRHMGADYEQQIETAMAVIDSLKAERDKLENGIDEENPFLTAFKKYENIDKLTREILIELVDYIKVYEGGDISIKFKFADELRRIMEYVEINRDSCSRRDKSRLLLPLSFDGFPNMYHSYVDTVGRNKANSRPDRPARVC